MNRKTKKKLGSTSQSKMPSIFKKSPSDPGTLSETHRKVLHRCRMMLMKDLDVTDILEYMSQDDGFKSDVRDTVLSYSERERRVATLLDRLESRGDRTFTLFMESLREHYKHLHYVMEETLRTAGDTTDREYRQSLSGESVRRLIRHSMKRKSQYSQGFDSVDELDSQSSDEGDETYIQCYSIPFHGRLQRENWIRQHSHSQCVGSHGDSQPSGGYAQNLSEYSPDGGTNMDGQSEDSYMAVVLKDLLFKRIELSEVPVGVKRPPTHCQVYVLDTDNKYGFVGNRNRSKVEVTGTFQSRDTEKLPHQNVTLETQVSQEVPDYTAPPPPSKSKQQRLPSATEEDEVTTPPPPLPPKPGNLPAVAFTHSGARPKVTECSQPLGEGHKKVNGDFDSDEEMVIPPPRSTSLLQSRGREGSTGPRTQTGDVGNKSIPNGGSKHVAAPGSKFLINKSRFEKSGSVSPPVSDSSGSSPPIPPRKYMDHNDNISNSLSGAGALASLSVSQLSPTDTHKMASHISQLDVTVSEPPHHHLKVVEVKTLVPGSPKAVAKGDTPASTTSDTKSNGLDLDDGSDLGKVKVTGSEAEFDPYSMGVDDIFQANGDLGVHSSDDTKKVGRAKEEDDATEDSNQDYDVDQQIPVPDEDYEAVEGGYEEKNSSSVIEKSSADHEDTSGNKERSRESTPYDSEDAKLESHNSSGRGSRDNSTQDSREGSTRDSRDGSTFDSSFKASFDSLDSNITPGSQAAAQTDSDGVFNKPPLMIPQKTTGHQKNGTMSSRPLPKDPPLPTVGATSLADVQVLASDGSSDTDSYYEDIDVLDKDKLPKFDSSERTSVSYLDPKTYFKAIERMAQQGSIHRDSTLKRIAIVEEWEASGRALVTRSELVVADTQEAYSTVPSVSSDTTHSSQGEEAAVGGEDTNSNSNQGSNDTVETTSASSGSVHEIESKDLYKEYRNTKLVYDKVGRAFYMPSQYIKAQDEPVGEPWFYPVPLSSHQATLFLTAQKQHGCFLVYKPSHKPSSNTLYNLSLYRVHNQVLHYHIVKNAHGDVMIQGHDHSFLNVKDLVQYFQRNKSQLATKLRRPLREANLPITPGYHYDLKWEISRSHLSLTGAIIGRGNYGVVCAGRYHSNIPVAVKVLQKSDATLQEEDDFIDEAKCLMGLNHDHIVRFVGLSCTSKPFFLVYEYLPKGSLRECLQSGVVPSDNIEQLFDLCVQITSAMYYLESQKYVLHRDLASRNFLVADDLCVKLADFGRARFVSDDNYQAPRSEKIPVKWASPEVLLESSYSTKSDVWALGVVFWEILSGGLRPYDGLTGDQTAVYITEGGRLDKPTKCPLDLYNMMCSCWHCNPHYRPSFAELYDKLKSKSSIYYSGPIRAEPALPKSKKKDGSHHNHHHHNHALSLSAGQKSPLGVTSPLGNKSKVKRSQSESGKKVRHTVMIETTRTSASTSNSTRNDSVPDGGMKARPMSGGSERLLTSGSETSLNNSSLLLPGLDDLTRGGKIRKSLRKFINMGPKRKQSSSSKLDGVKEYSPAQSMQANQY